MDIKTEICGNVDEYTHGVCYLPKGHEYSHEVRFGYKPDNRFIQDDIDLNFMEAYNSLRELGISDLATRNQLYYAQYGKRAEKCHVIRGNSVIWVKIVYISATATFWVYAQTMVMSV